MEAEEVVEATALSEAPDFRRTTRMALGHAEDGPMTSTVGPVALISNTTV